MPELVFASQFQADYSQLQAYLPQSVLLHGVKGVGLATIAHSLTGKNSLTIGPVDAKGLPSEQGSVGVERIRELYQQTRSKGSLEHVVIDDADRMTTQAQNAFLKLLEEPPSSVHFILTSHRPELLLPTIRSRVSSYHVPPISAESSTRILAMSKLPATGKQQALFMANGRPAELYRLINEPENLTAAASVMSDARTMLSAASIYDRLAVALRYSSSRSSALQLTDGALAIIRHTLYTNASTELAERAERLLDARKAILHNHSPRLQLSLFVLQ